MGNNNITTSNNGFVLFKKFLNAEIQKELLNSVYQIIETSPFFINHMWNEQPFKVGNTNAGPYGWCSNSTKGYFYTNKHPETGLPWAPIPKLILDITNDLINKSGYKSIGFKPESCYINFYDRNSSLGLHRDDTEQDLTAPIVSISIGDTAEFYLGGSSKKDKLKKLFLESGDCYVQGGQSRLFYHQVKKISFKSSNLIEGGGRINLTIRQVNSQLKPF